MRPQQEEPQAATCVMQRYKLTQVQNTASDRFEMPADSESHTRAKMLLGASSPLTAGPKQAKSLRAAEEPQTHDETLHWECHLARHG